MRLAETSVCPQIRHGAGTSTAASASTAFRMITEALLLVRLTRDASALPEASEGTKLRTEIYGTEALDRCGCGTPIRMRADAKFKKEVLQQALLHLFLAGDAIAGPRHSFQALLLKFLMAGHAFAETVVFDARQSVVHEL
jgi:hypothetical protein